MFGRKVPRGNLGELFKCTFQKILSILYSNHKALSLEFGYEIELYAFLYAVTLFLALSKKKPLQDALLRDFDTVCDSYFQNINSPYTFKRRSFYFQIAETGNVRNEWFLTDYPARSDFNMFIAFGDCLYNPSCIRDYSNASVSVRSIFDQMEFNRMMGEIREVLLSYCKSFTKL